MNLRPPPSEDGTLTGLSYTPTKRDIYPLAVLVASRLSILALRIICQQMSQQIYDVIIIGAGAAGMMCGARAGMRGRKVLILDHAKAAGEKIRISGGGRCNFTNMYSGSENFISQNLHFCKSALAGFTPQDFIGLVETYGIAWHEKSKGQLFCNGRAGQIVQMLLDECAKGGNEVRLETDIHSIEKSDQDFVVCTSKGDFIAGALVVACGGPSIPKMGASGSGYRIAQKFGLNVIDPCPALVPLTFADCVKKSMRELAGVSVDVRVCYNKTVFEEALLFTHRGLSGPSILQISSYWSPGGSIIINLVPGTDMLSALKRARNNHPKQSPANVLSDFLPTRLAQSIVRGVLALRLADMSDAALMELAGRINKWTVTPAGSEGFRTAEVTRGGVDTRDLSSKTMQAKNVSGLYFIGEVVDVTGHLGGHNFQWAWASGIAAGNAL